MKIKILFIERKYWRKDFFAFSLEKVFEQVSKLLPTDKFESSIVKVPFGNSFIEILKNLIFFEKSDADIYHITGQIHYLSLILPPSKTVLTIHDLGFLNNDRKISKYLVKKLFLDLPVKRLKYITTVSETTREGILKNTGCSPEKIRVIENPIQQHYINGKQKDFNKECPTILQIGITENKNLYRLIKALKGIRCRLKIIGNLTPELISALSKDEINYENAFGLDDLSMRKEFENADLMTFCSTFEGFGLPIIEAQGMKVPVITSNISPMKEVAGGGACLVDPFDESDIRKGLLKIFHDDEFRDGIIRKGSENIERFLPENITQSYQKLYFEIVSSNNN